MGAEARLAELKLELPPIPKPGGIYKPVVQVGSLLYFSGHGPLRTDKTLITGKVGLDLTETEAKEAARVTGLTILATIRQHLGSLDRVVRTIKLLGMVNAVPDFQNHPAVINGCSELFRELWGEDGVGTRSAVGLGSLPGNIAIEIEGIFEIRD
ncbi:RidA family protein [Planctomicrobium sp. SH661]|uniref:RidA family protein n=1 Tax=Planctomicrobium sp. SH661 TaxID=3448124 RepID=UPI003F5C7BF2